MQFIMTVMPGFVPSEREREGGGEAHLEAEPSLAHSATLRINVVHVVPDHTRQTGGRGSLANRQGEDGTAEPAQQRKSEEVIPLLHLILDHGAGALSRVTQRARRMRGKERDRSQLGAGAVVLELVRSRGPGPGGELSTMWTQHVLREYFTNRLHPARSRRSLCLLAKR